MKTLKIVVLAVVTVVMASCGSQKQIAVVDPYSNQVQEELPQAPQRVKIAKEECEELALEESELLRGYGVSSDADKMFARDIAATNARNEIVNQIEVTASNMMDIYNQQHKQSGEEGMNSETVGKVQGTIRSVAEETLKGARMVCSNTYMVGSKYEVHVCVELTGVDFAQKAFDAISNEDNLRTDFEASKFKKDFNTELERIREKKRAE